MEIALDINQEIKKFAADGVSTIIADCADMKEIADNSIDVVFASELLEHLKNTDELLATLTEIQRVLKDKGRIIILCPNIRYLADKYWDFIDHRLALSHLGLQEALLLYNYKIMKVIPRFLPYTTKSRFPKSSIIMRIYLKLPILWRIFGKQMLIIAEKY
jgi:ubiquinone/menaquinone biosynthesis C-methylase UbiE